MCDILLGLLVLFGLSLFALLAGLRSTNHGSDFRTAAIAIVAFVALLLFVAQYHGTWQMARLLPFSCVVVLGNWIPLGGAFLAGIVLGRRKVPQWRRFALASLLLLVSGYSVACCFLGQLPGSFVSTGRWNGATQTRRSSCGACCAAELLRHHGIAANEEELLGLCLTSYRGSPALGLYRGLKLKTADTEWDVKVVSCPFDELLRSEGPLLLRILLPPKIETGVKVRGDFLSKGRLNHRVTERGCGHAVLLMGVKDNDHVQIFDPAIPEDRRMMWRIEDLRERWLGEALRLVPRS